MYSGYRETISVLPIDFLSIDNKSTEISLNEKILLDIINIIVRDDNMRKDILSSIKNNNTTYKHFLDLIPVKLRVDKNSDKVVLNINDNKITISKDKYNIILNNKMSYESMINDKCYHSECKMLHTTLYELYKLESLTYKDIVNLKTDISSYGYIYMDIPLDLLDIKDYIKEVTYLISDDTEDLEWYPYNFIDMITKININDIDSPSMRRLVNNVQTIIEKHNFDKYSYYIYKIIYDMFNREWNSFDNDRILKLFPILKHMDDFIKPKSIKYVGLFKKDNLHVHAVEDHPFKRDINNLLTKILL